MQEYLERVEKYTDDEGKQMQPDTGKIERDDGKLLHRQKEIDYVKITPCYLVYLKTIPRYPAFPLLNRILAKFSRKIRQF